MFAYHTEGWGFDPRYHINRVWLCTLAISALGRYTARPETLDYSQPQREFGPHMTAHLKQKWMFRVIVEGCSQSWSQTLPFAAARPNVKTQRLESLPLNRMSLLQSPGSIRHQCYALSSWNNMAIVPIYSHHQWLRVPDFHKTLPISTQSWVGSSP